MRLLTILICIFFYYETASKEPIKIAKNYLKIEVIKELLYVDTDTQKLHHIKENKIIKTYIISSSKKGTGNKSGSKKTPLGLHVIKKKYGDKTPINGRMIGRVFYGEIATIYKDKTESITDDITSRIFWLEGMEEGINKGTDIDSFKRYIYIHGTSEEGLLGTAASHGCIRMKNKEVIDLYNKIAIGTLVLIL